MTNVNTRPATAATPTPDPEQARPLVHRLVQTAGGKPGKFVIAAYGDIPAMVRHVANGPEAAAKVTDRIMDAIHELAVIPDANVYIMPALMRRDLPEGQKGKIADVEAMLALVTDFDDADAAKYQERLPLAPHAVVETSPGKFHCWYFLAETSYDPREEVAPVLKELVARAGTDRSGAEISHVFREPGCLNNPNQSKLKKGRSSTPELSKLVGANTWEAVTLDELRKAIVARWPDAFTAPARKSTPSDARKSTSSDANGAPVRGTPVQRKRLEEVLSWIDPGDRREKWLTIIAAIRATVVGECEEDGDDSEDYKKELARRWSYGDLDREEKGRPVNYEDDDAVDAVYDTMPPIDGGVAFGTIYNAAVAAGFVGPADAPRPISERFAHLATPAPMTMTGPPVPAPMTTGPKMMTVLA
jgi:hypothetical protein